MNIAKAKFFDLQVDAPWAAEEYGDEERPKIERLLRETGLGPGHTVLEPGCGSGRLTEVLAKAVGPTGKVLALDISEGMVAACRERVYGMAQVEARRAAMEELNLPPAGLDHVICHQVFPHFDDQPRALELMRGWLKPGGVLAVVHFISAAEINDTHRKAGTVVEQDLLPGPDEMRAMMAAAGMAVEMLLDDGLGYFLRARRS